MPGIFAALLSLLVRGYYFEPEISTVSRVLYDLVFLIFALLMTRITRTRNELEVSVAERTAELTRANEDLKLEIAERKRAEENLRQSEAYLHEAQKMGRMGSWAQNVISGSFFASPSCSESLAATPMKRNPLGKCFESAFILETGPRTSKWLPRRPAKRPIGISTIELFSQTDR